MIIKTIEDIRKIDGELAALFLRPELAVSWICTVNGSIKEWIGKHNKQHWEVVRYVSHKQGILGIMQTDQKTVKLTRKDFAKVLVKYCPEALKKGDTAGTLKTSMEHYRYNNDLRNTPTGTALAHIREVEDLLAKHPMEQPVDEKKPILEDLMYKYLERTISGNENRFPRSVLQVRQEYKGATPALSVETYYSERFLREKTPSHIDAYEFFDETLTLSKLNELIGVYGDFGMARLFIVSEHGLLPDVRARALDKNVGYVLLDPSKDVAGVSYELPRSVEDYVKRANDQKMLTGELPMKYPMLVMDGSMLTSSLTDVLIKNGVAVNPNRLLKVPYLPEDEIERRTDELTGDAVDEIISLVRTNYLALNTELSVDPFTIAKQVGLTYDVEDMQDDSQLGRLDVTKGHAILNFMEMHNYCRFRFTMAHELGHFILHTELFSRFSVISLGETSDTLSDNLSVAKSDLKRLEYQANIFASCLLMPRKLVMTLFAIFHELFVHQVYGDKYGPIYYNPKQPETYSTYNNVVVRIAKLLDVSQEALCIKLKALGLLKMPIICQ